MVRSVYTKGTSSVPIGSSIHSFRCEQPGHIRSRSPMNLSSKGYLALATANAVCENGIHKPLSSKACITSTWYISGNGT